MKQLAIENYNTTMAALNYAAASAVFFHITQEQYEEIRKKAQIAHDDLVSNHGENAVLEATRIAYPSCI